MSEANSGLAAIHAAATSISRADHDAALAAANTTATFERETAVTAARAEGEAAGRTAGATAERTRISAIVAAPEAKGREALAQTLAFKTDMTAEQAIEVMKGTPENKTSRLDGAVPVVKVDANDAKNTPAAGLAAAVTGLVTKRFGAAAVAKAS